MIFCLLNGAFVIETNAQDTLSSKVAIDSPKIDSQKVKFNNNNETDLKKAASSNRKKQIDPFERQFRLMTDLFNPIMTIFNSNQYAFELLGDYNFRKDKFVTVAVGYGGGKINYPNLKYNSNNAYFKVGIDFSMFDALYKSDWDMVTVGFKYGVGIGQRSAASFSIPNPFGNEIWSEVAAKNFFAHWLDIAMGIRFEILPRVYTGWNVRFSLNFSPGIFDGQVSPKLLAGYGQSSKATSLGFNFYIGYALRWNKKTSALSH